MLERSCGSPLLSAGALLKRAARVGRISPTFARDADNVLGIQAAHPSLVGVVSGVAKILGGPAGATDLAREAGDDARQPLRRLERPVLQLSRSRNRDDMMHAQTPQSDMEAAMAERMYGGLPTLLPGQAAGALLWRALLWIVVAVLAAPAMVVQAYVPYQELWVSAWLMVATAALALFARGLKRARDRERQEVTRGYTTMLQVAREQPGLFLVDPETKVVLAAPGEARPADIRRKTVEAWVAQRTP